MSGVVVRLYAVINGQTQWQAEVQTNVTGNYSFTHLVAGSYIVEFITPSGYELTTLLNDMSKDASDSDVEPSTRRTNLVELVTGELSLTNDVGYWQPLTINDSVWIDNNKNNKRDELEVGLSDVIVQLWRNGRVISTTSTLSNGNYSFTNLISGVYSMSFQASNVYTFTDANVGSDATDSDVIEVVIVDSQSAIGNTASFTIGPNASTPHISAGFVLMPAVLELRKTVQTQHGGVGAAVSPNDHLTYTLIARNIGATPITVNDIVITDPLDTGIVEYIAGSALPPVFADHNGNMLEWRLGALQPGESKVVKFSVKIKQNINNVKVSNVAYLRGDQGNAIAVTRESSRVDNPLEPAAVTLTDFSAIRAASGMAIKWATSSEINSWSFAIYRVAGVSSSHTLPINAIKINPVAILAEGRASGGASYHFFDATAQADMAYTYWLIETELDGTTNTYGPAKQYGSRPTRIFLSSLWAH